MCIRDSIERAVVVAQNTADAIARREGSEVKLLEDLDLQLPFLLPEDGYSCDFVTGCNAELVAFLEPLRQAGIVFTPTYWLKLLFGHIACIA